MKFKTMKYSWHQSGGDFSHLGKQNVSFEVQLTCSWKQVIYTSS